jgi:hypothetical protein
MEACYDAAMKRTTVFLLDELHDRLRNEAFATRVSMAQPGNSDPLAKVEGIVRDGHLSEGIDEALYSS